MNENNFLKCLRIKKKGDFSAFRPAAFLAFLLLTYSIESAPRFALILSGGGARGLSQIGVLKALESNGIRPDLIVATSMGAIIGALYSAGFSADSIASIAHIVDWNKIFSNNSLRKSLFVSQKNLPSNALVEIRFDYNLKPVLPTSISYGQSFYEILAPLLVIPQCKAGFDFDSLPIPLRIIATDLLSGDKVVFSKGNLCTAIRASCAVPLAFSPVEMNGTLIIDGGVAANIPVETARQMGAEIVVAIDATSPFAKKEELDNPVTLVDQIVGIGVAHRKDREKSQADLVISPELGNIKKTDFHAIDSLIAIGYRTGDLYSDSIAMLLGSKRLSKEGLLHPAWREEDSIDYRPKVDRIVVSGNKRTSEKLVIKASGVRIGDSLSSELIRNTINSLYATYLFDNVNLDIDSLGTCRIMVEEKKYWRVRMGLRFDEFHLGEGYVEPAFENCLGLGIITLFHLQYGLRREKYAMELQSNQLFSSDFASIAQMQVYSSKEKIQQIDTMAVDSTTMISTTSLTEQTLRKTGFGMYFGAQLGRFSLLNVGMRLERFKVQKKDPDMLGDFIGMSLKEILPYFSIRLTMDSMDKYPFARSGVRQFLSIGGANKRLGGKYSFIKCSGSIGRYLTLLKYHTFFSSFSFSWASDALPQVERPFLGGVFSEEQYQEMNIYNYIPFYGLPPRAVSGDLFGICHLEYRCEIKKNIFTHLILNWGTAWDYGYNDYRKLTRDAPIGIGIGISYLTILGPIRLSYGELIKNRRSYLLKRNSFFYFSAGYDF